MIVNPIIQTSHGIKPSICTIGVVIVNAVFTNHILQELQLYLLLFFIICK
jgi:hypothetical protein